jgi:hypothetical protein
MSQVKTKLMQCTRCGFLKGGMVDLRPCTESGEHRFRALEAKLLASALGSFGGSEPRYKSEEIRRAARLFTFAKSNARRRGLPMPLPPPELTPTES